MQDTLLAFKILCRFYDWLANLAQRYKTNQKLALILVSV